MQKKKNPAVNAAVYTLAGVIFSGIGIFQVNKIMTIIGVLLLLIGLYWIQESWHKRKRRWR
ncbi:MAG: hypothetical protein IIA87_01380 [Nanoarchaeota archaeon]|nr:hypothetical protein [Nanoarchaeota archaeon]